MKNGAESIVREKNCQIKVSQKTIILTIYFSTSRIAHALNFVPAECSTTLTLFLVLRLYTTSTDKLALQVTTNHRQIVLIGDVLSCLHLLCSLKKMLFYIIVYKLLLLILV